MRPTTRPRALILKYGGDSPYWQKYIMILLLKAKFVSTFVASQKSTLRFANYFTCTYVARYSA